MDGVQQSYHIWQCDNCGHTERKEEEIICWECGKGEMLYQGEFWEEAEPLPMPSRWEVFKEGAEELWKANAGDPDDPNGLGVNLLGVVMWGFIFGIVGLGIVIFT